MSSLAPELCVKLVVIAALAQVVTSQYPTSCREAFQPDKGSGVYYINLTGSALEPFPVYCQKDDQTNEPWTVIQRRVNGNTDFQRNWNEYKLGFGDLNENFWIGLDKLHSLTSDPNNPQELWIQLKDNIAADARYSRFVIGNEFEFYTLKELGDFVGSAGDSLSVNAGMKFSSYDYDNDASPNVICAPRELGAWWYNNCGFSNLNGLYGDTYKGVYWHSFRQWKSMTSAQMAIRPASSGRTPLKFNANAFVRQSPLLDILYTKTYPNASNFTKD